MLAREDLLLALFPRCVKHICAVPPSQGSRQQFVPHGVPETMFVPDFRRREARAAGVAQEDLSVVAAGLVTPAVRGGRRRLRWKLVRSEVFLQVSLSPEFLPAVAALINFVLRQRLDKRHDREGLRLLRGQLGALLWLSGQYQKT